MHRLTFQYIFIVLLGSASGGMLAQHLVLWLGAPHWAGTAASMAVGFVWGWTVGWVSSAAQRARPDSERRW